MSRLFRYNAVVMKLHSEQIEVTRARKDRKYVEINSQGILSAPRAE